MCLFLKLLFFLSLLSVYHCEYSDIVNKKVERKIDLGSQLAKVSSKVTLENAGSQSVKSFVYSLAPEEAERLAYISAQTSGSSLEVGAKIDDKNITKFAIELASQLNPGESVTVDVETIFTHSLVPYPVSISQGEKQMVLYEANHYHFSPYLTATQMTTIQLPSPNLESFSKLKPSSHSDTVISYGPYENISPFSQNQMRIHYENNSPFLTVSNIERVIEVSHWGNIAVEETIDVYHSGATLKGPFSRYDYQREHNTYSSIKSFKTILPASAKDVYYRDEIGNISTSHMRIQDDAVELDLRPRFPLFGGWKTHYVIGYNVPSYEYLYNSGDRYTLKMRFLDHIFDDMAVEHLMVKVILPEGSKNIKLDPPYVVKRHPDSLHFTYLDTVGRPVITASKDNLVEMHIQDMQLHYQFPSILMLQEPMLVVIVFLILFLTVIAYEHLDLTLSKDDITEAKMRVSSHCEIVHSHHDKRSCLYEKLEDEIQRLKSSKDIPQSQVATKKIIAGIKEETQAITELGAKIRADNAEYAEKVADLQKLEKSLRDCVCQQLTNVEKLVSGKMSKQTYMDVDQPLNKKKEDFLEKVKAVLVTI